MRAPSLPALARLAVLPLLVAALVLGASIGRAEAPRKPRIVMLTHGQASDSFWTDVIRGAEAAAARYGVDFSYRAPAAFDMAALAAMLDQAVAEQPDGIAIALADPDALAPAVRRAVAAGVPVVTLNSGSDVALSIGSALHVGQDEYDAGAAAGERFRALGAKSALCVNHEVGNISLDLRCKGFIDSFRGAVEVVPVPLDPAEAEVAIREALEKSGKIEAILGLGAPFGGEAALRAVAAAGLEGSIKVATFDLSGPVVEAIRSGRLAFAIDQQPFLQGYLPVEFLAIRFFYGAMPSGRIASGPSLVDQTNVEMIVGKRGG